MLPFSWLPEGTKWQRQRLRQNPTGWIWRSPRDSRNKGRVPEHIRGSARGLIGLKTMSRINACTLAAKNPTLLHLLRNPALWTVPNKLFSRSRYNDGISWYRPWLLIYLIFSLSPQWPSQWASASLPTHHMPSQSLFQLGAIMSPTRKAITVSSPPWSQAILVSSSISPSANLPPSANTNMPCTQKNASCFLRAP